jgi:hypothetical protein
MTEPESTIPLAGIASQAHAAIGQFVADMQEHLGPDLTSITVVGSATGPDFQAGVSDINTVLLLSRLDRSGLDVISGMGKGLHKRHLALPLLMTSEYIERSRDVFGVELLDFQLSGQTVLGDDPFEGLTFERSDVRLQCERELKAMLIRLRQGYMASAGNVRLLRDVLVSSGKTLLPYLRAMVWLNEGDRENSIQGTLSQARETLGIETAALDTLVQWRNTKVKVKSDALILGFDATYTVIEQLADWVDSHEV